MTKLFPACVMAVALLASPALFAEWTVHHDSFAKSWVVTDGKQSIRTKTKKAAKKMAKAINKAESKSVYDDGSGNCNDGSSPRENKPDC